MRIGDFGVEVVPRGKGIGVRETASGHVLARPGQVYALRIRNYGPLRCVAEVSIDGRTVSAGGLVVDAWTTTELERPISPDEDGCFTVIAEGDERVFGPDGGRDNPHLGLIEVRFRRELPPGPDEPRPLPPSVFGRLDLSDAPRSFSSNPPDRAPRWNASASRITGAPNGHLPRSLIARIDPLDRGEPARPFDGEPSLGDDGGDIEGAAGTGLTGHSSQRFEPIQLGKLEAEATTIQLRLVVSSADAIRAALSAPESSQPPARPAARP
jgi:hypothetical protein